MTSFIIRLILCFFRKRTFLIETKLYYNNWIISPFVTLLRRGSSPLNISNPKDDHLKLIKICVCIFSSRISILWTKGAPQDFLMVTSTLPKLCRLVSFLFQNCIVLVVGTINYSEAPVKKFPKVRRCLIWYYAAENFFSEKVNPGIRKFCSSYFSAPPCLRLPAKTRVNFNISWIM